MAKSKYQTHVFPKLFLVENWAKDGLTDEEIAKRLGIATSTFYEYKLNYPEFSESLKRGKEVVDYEVEQSLLKRALGYTYVEITREPDSEGVMRITKETTKTVAPDTTAQIFWLKNRKPVEWRDKQEIGVDSESLTGIKISFVNKSNSNKKKEIDPKIVGDYTPPSNVDDHEV